MSLYFEGSTILEDLGSQSGSLKSRVYGNKNLKSPPGAVFAAVSEAIKWNDVLKEVIEKSGILTLERKLTPTLALLLVHDLLLAKKGIAAPKQHALTLSVTKHRARLTAELTKCRIRRGFATIDALREHIETSYAQATRSGTGEEGSTTPLHPRWIRVNTIKATLSDVLGSTLATYTATTSLSDLFQPDAKLYYQDPHIPNLLALPPTIELAKSKAYLNGEIIYQDKASCFPAYLLHPSSSDKHIIDACAAPGNKTTHLAALVHELCTESAAPKITACERSGPRAATLKKMVRLAGATVSVRAGQDFLALKPESDEWKDVTALLLDPSCSGSGIVGRDDENEGAGGAAVGSSIAISLPEKVAEKVAGGKGRKRKRGERKVVVGVEEQGSAAAATAVPEADEDDTLADVDGDDSTSKGNDITTRLTNLSNFQLKLLNHAMRFPAARKITYSTCSVHAIENEDVVCRALMSGLARGRGWRVLRREEQVDGLRMWERRGDVRACRANIEGGGEVADEIDPEVVGQACIRCEKGTEEGTMGFFVCGFVRDGDKGSNGRRVKKQIVSEVVEDGDDESGSEWGGFAD